MRHLNLTACVVLVLGSACVDLTPPHAVPDAGDGGVIDAPIEQAEDAPIEVAPPDAASADGGEGGAEVGDGGGPTDAGTDAPNLHTGLIGYWKLDTNANSTAVDSSGLGNNGMITGAPTLITSALPAPLTFDVAAFTFSKLDDAVAIPSNASLSPTELTVALWVNFSSPTAHNSCGPIDSGVQYLFHRRTPRTNGNIEGVALLRTRDNKLGFILGDSQGSQTSIADMPAGLSAVSTGIWYHVAGTFVPPPTAGGVGQVRFYVNGSLTPNGAVPRTSTVEFGTRPVYLARSGECMTTGTGDTNWDAELSGSLDDVRFYNRALTGLEVQALFQGQDF